MDWLVDLPGKLASALYTYRVEVALAGIVALAVFLWLARRRGWFAAARRHPGRSAVLAAVLLAVGLPVGWYLGSPLIVRTALDEPLPVTTEAPLRTLTPTGEPTAGQSVAPLQTSQPARTGEFHGTDEFHFGRGTATLIETLPGMWIVRFERFSVRNGPDLYVYVSPDPDGYADDAVELGTLKATDGAFNYDVPAGTDLSKVRSVLIWCKQFSHLFAVAPLA
ncbi:MAG TPA: DM13 domain-containing protein [Candidatus Limnocylindrales bacterium]|nr:DM13 domain-containing protein [Candidatus Limnocylindrales bacterium]